MNLLHLGCGSVRLPGYVNVDCQARLKPDVVADLSKHPWPWKDNSVDGIYSSHCFEHLPDITATMKECHRVLKPGRPLEAVVPYALSSSFHDSPGHVSAWTERTVYAFVAGLPEHVLCEESFELVFSTLLDTGPGLTWKWRLRNLAPRWVRMAARSCLLGMFDQVHFKLRKPL